MTFTLLLASYVLSGLGSLWIIVLAWQKGIVWGLACLFIPVVQLIYVALNWKQTKSAFLLVIAGLVLFGISQGTR